MPRLSRAERQAQTRERLLETAGRVFVRDGYVKASLDRMADEAGYSKGAIYSNFEDKEALFLEILSRKFADDLKNLRQLLALVDDTDTLIATLREHYENNIEILDITLVAVEFLTQIARGSPHAQACAALYDEQRGSLATLFKTLFNRSGKGLPAPAKDLATSLIAQTMGLAIQRSIDREAVTPSQWGASIELQLRSLLAVGGHC